MLAELQQIRMMLRALPEPALERSFLLPETGAIPKTLSRHAKGTQARHRTRRILPAPALQWIGGLVAVVGLFILITTTLSGHSQGLASSAYAPVNGSSSASHSTSQANPKQTPVPASTGVKVPVTLQPSYTTLSPTAMSTATASITGRPATSEPTSTRSNGESTALFLGPLAGAALAISGAVFFVTGTVQRRRRKGARGTRQT